MQLYIMKMKLKERHSYRRYSANLKGGRRNSQVVSVDLSKEKKAKNILSQKMPLWFGN